MKTIDEKIENNQKGINYADNQIKSLLSMVHTLERQIKQFQNQKLALMEQNEKWIEQKNIEKRKAK